MGFDDYKGRKVYRDYDPFIDQRQWKYFAASGPDFEKYEVYLEDNDRHRLTIMSMLAFTAARLGDAISLTIYLMRVVASLFKIANKYKN